MILIDTQKEEFSKLKKIRIFGKSKGETGFYGDLLVIGLGGVGRQCVTAYKGMMRDKITQEDNINFLLIDSNIPEMEETIKESREGLGLNALEVISIYRPNLENLIAQGTADGPVQETIAKWMRPGFPALTIGREGAEGNRQIGRLMFSNAYEDMRILLFEKLDDIRNRSATGKLDVIIVSGIGGGTGSGILADVAYNIRAYAKSRKWQNFRIGGCLLTPDVLYANPAFKDNWKKRGLLDANGYATLLEMEQLMTLTDKGNAYTFESGTHRLSIKENIFDSCMLVSGKEDKAGYLPESVIYTDVAYFLLKLSTMKHVGNAQEGEEDILLRDAFFGKNGSRLFKVLNESDYRIPIREIENICEYQIFKEAYKRLHPGAEQMPQVDSGVCYQSLRTFLQGQPTDPIELNVNGLIKVQQFAKPNYKQIKKGQDEFRTSVPRMMNSFREDIPVMVKALKNDLITALNAQIQDNLQKYGPFVAISMIGAKGYEGLQEDTGLVAEAKQLDLLCREQQPSGDYGRIVESILNIVSKRFFAFPSAKRETENGYYDACTNQILEEERKALRDGLNDQDVFGDVIRMLRQRAEQLNDIYSHFDQDLTRAVEDLASDGKRIVGYLLKNAKRHEFLPSDYVTDARIEDMRNGIIQLMVNHEADIDSGRVVPIRQEMEKIYKNVLTGIGVYAPEKLIVTAFADKIPTLQEANMMFVSQDNSQREEIMNRAAAAFVEGASEKVQKKKMCLLKKEGIGLLSMQRIISLPEDMPYFSEAVKKVLTSPPHNESERSITLNLGELELSMEDIYVGVPKEQLQCIDDLRQGYAAIDQSTYFGLHTNETA
ncbi:MAG: hypothetical protein IKQ49_08195 [Eubacterium sp.]|nr:hypothetical protein [Eubacterium sp.]